MSATTCARAATSEETDCASQARLRLRCQPWSARPPSSCPLLSSLPLIVGDGFGTILCASTMTPETPSSQGNDIHAVLLPTAVGWCYRSEDGRREQRQTTLA